MFVDLYQDHRNWDHMSAQVPLWHFMALTCSSSQDHALSQLARVCYLSTNRLVPVEDDEAIDTYVPAPCACQLEICRLCASYL